MPFTMLKKFPYISNFLRVFIIESVLDLIELYYFQVINIQ